MLRRSSRLSRRQDRISEIPDEVLTHILSFLTTRSAIGTSLLAKRFRGVWLNVESIVVMGEYVSDHISDHRLKRFIDHVMEKREEAAPGEFHPIKSFCFEVKYFARDMALGLSHLASWLTISIKKNLQNLRLHMKSISCYNVIYPMLPMAVSGCKGLVDLELVHFSLVGFSFDGIEFSLLQNLVLKLVLFDSKSFLAFLAKCKAVKKLKLIGIDLSFEKDKSFEKDSTEDFSIDPLPKLNSAVFSECSLHNFPFQLLALSESLHFSCEDFNPYKLIEDGSAMAFLQIPTFERLKSLNFKGTRDSVLQILSCSPNLQILIFTQDSFATEWNGEDDGNFVKPDNIPKCMSSITNCIVQSIITTRDMSLLNYLLGNAVNLRTLDIGIEKGKSKSISEKDLSDTWKASRICEVTFS
ncbi:F-box/FBD/LRR-repeat protein At5g44980-like [Vicia villosa]|uniref:F-box/FBD/LRR-repeat protein At5g44980-like n=1 Tax=Vicia villosa TaxID=3911 RepID=UPI00273B02DB|nr:F-box/FBD/LRR-repeat protein At5g44980-like [Vicia villosa]XP_058771843.1 F-box/FBD/LRR-repeat protein At5g44980-like [Vicia villosa]XP_058771844.1 F-box/FBD/LRR-repeat protein At5g44980-like [Vicia villosa]XP_058771845.1 F-box/FBD/LRR-repeat protein At5g44980-like [Vicia villosa]